MTRRGFTILEILSTVIVIGIVAGFGTRVLTFSLRSAHDAGQLQDAMMRFDSAMNALRDDVQNADHWSVTDSTITFDDRIIWQDSADGLRRTEAGHLRVWTGVQLAFASNPAGVELRSREGNHEPIVLLNPTAWLKAVAR
ncbi:MAG: type II secretion system protein [Phycisphaerae bacterium]|nr:type II secretion system protein [Phycisphaerae bacterium]